MAGRPPGRLEMILEKNETFTVTEAMIPPQMSVTIDDAREAVRIFADLNALSGGDQGNQH